MTEKKTKKKLTKKQKIRWSIIGSVTALALIIIMVLLQNSSSGHEEVTYTTYEMKNPEPLLFKGNVEADHVEQFYLDQSMGKISQIHVQNGQQVEAGTVLYTYQNDTQEEQVDQNEIARNKNATAVQNAKNDVEAAESKLSTAVQKNNNARNEYNSLAATDQNETRRQELKAEITQLDATVEQAEETLRVAKQALTTAQGELNATVAQIDETKTKVTTNITSPISGVVYINEAGKTSVATPVIQVVSPTVTVKGQASEYDFSRLKTDQSVVVKPLSTKEKIVGVITYINQLPESQTAPSDASNGGAASAAVNYTFNVKPEKDIQYGYSVQIQLPIEELRIPKSALRKDGNEQYVFVYNKGKVTKRVIKVEEKGSFQVVTAGLEKGDRIIENPDGNLKDGQEVAVSQ